MVPCSIGAKTNHNIKAIELVCAFTKPPLFQRNGLTCSGNPLFESCVEGKAKQREIAGYSRSSFQSPQH
jgi:hypothetical protein